MGREDNIPRMRASKKNLPHKLKLRPLGMRRLPLRQEGDFKYLHIFLKIFTFASILLQSAFRKIAVLAVLMVPAQLNIQAPNGT